MRITIDTDPTNQLTRIIVWDEADKVVDRMAIGDDTLNAIHRIFSFIAKYEGSDDLKQQFLQRLDGSYYAVADAMRKMKDVQ